MKSCIRVTAKVVLSIPAKTAHHHPKHPTKRTPIQQWPLLWHWPVSICKNRVETISSSCLDPFLALFLEQEARIHTSLNFGSINPALTFREAQTYHSKQLWSMFPLQGYLPQVQSGHSGKGLSRKENTGFEGCVWFTSTPNILKQTLACMYQSRVVWRINLQAPLPEFLVQDVHLYSGTDGPRNISLESYFKENLLLWFEKSRTPAFMGTILSFCFS